eukprot:CAMPEP_0202912820 /NCGR_PEP_ID=MMETSP1392-20130828/58732_1 /ASSEMBLY_ACC=CAM_ASM_000868 /TAXON_ID=225041 /ORGANISM="Chlamydomonas chlamydogama, Strain SAG 11-48b" /LENGTH=175 /DNA_ID=CAMNT_0049603863 /DNA_START=65 /DNA_END=588 /DNA_ORIENTATION=-
MNKALPVPALEVSSCSGTLLALLLRENPELSCCPETLTLLYIKQQQAHELLEIQGFWQSACSTASGSSLGSNACSAHDVSHGSDTPQQQQQQVQLLSGALVITQQDGCRRARRVISAHKATSPEEAQPRGTAPDTDTAAQALQESCTAVARPEQILCGDQQPSVITQDIAGGSTP